MKSARLKSFALLSSTLLAGLTVDATPIQNPDNGHWYEAITVPGGINWDSAKAYAEALNGHLATISSAQENQFIFVNFPEASLLNFFGYWLGGVQPGDTPAPDVDPAAGWIWVTGESFGTDAPLAYTNWNPGEPNDFGGKEDALHLWANIGTWNDIPREFYLPGFVIEYDTAPAPLLAKYNPATGHWYKAVTASSGITWWNAKAAAQAMGGYLATLTSAVENQFVFDQFPQASKLIQYGFWLGGFQPGDTTQPDADPAAGWTWITGEPWSFTNWTPGEPNDFPGSNFKEDALEFWNYAGTWNDLPAENSVSGFVVEFNTDPNDSDHDGIPDSQDSCPNSNLSPTVVVSGITTTVPNRVTSTGCSINDLIAECALAAGNHGEFVSCVAHLTQVLKSTGAITGAQKGVIDNAAARSNP